jgi:hypothetical protein
MSPLRFCAADGPIAPKASASVDKGRPSTKLLSDLVSETGPCVGEESE